MLKKEEEFDDTILQRRILNEDSESRQDDDSEEKEQGEDKSESEEKNEKSQNAEIKYKEVDVQCHEKN